MSKVSVVVPVYNAEKYLERAIRSLMEQTYSDVSIIIVDDGSTDRSPRIINKLMEIHNSNIVMCSQQHRGVSSARNLGLKFVNSDYVMFMDADDWVESDFVETHINAIGGTSKCSVANGYFYQNGINPEKIKKLSPDKILLFKAPAVWLRMFKTDFLRENEITFGDYSVGEDLNFTGKLHLVMNPNFTFTKKPSYHYHIREGSVSDGRQFDLFDAVRDLEEFAKERDCYDQNESFLEFMVINHILMAGVKRAGQNQQMLKDAIDKIIDFVNELHPNWYENRYIDMYTDDEEKSYLEAVKNMDRKAIIKFASPY